MQIAIVSGTNRSESNTLKVARLCDSHFRNIGASTTLLDLQSLPKELLSPTAYAAKPEEFSFFARAVLDCDGMLIVTPEYNGGFPGVLKLFIDMLPFPESFQDRPAAYVGLSAGRSGAVRPVEQLQQIFAYRNAFNFNERVFIPGIGGELDDTGQLKDTSLAKRLEDQAKHFLNFVIQVAAN